MRHSEGKLCTKSLPPYAKLIAPKEESEWSPSRSEELDYLFYTYKILVCWYNILSFGKRKTRLIEERSAETHYHIIPDTPQPIRRPFLWSSLIPIIRSLFHKWNVIFACSSMSRKHWFVSSSHEIRFQSTSFSVHSSRHPSSLLLSSISSRPIGFKR